MIDLGGNSVTRKLAMHLLNAKY